MRPRLSLCMIVKDEEHYLENCLASVRDVVDEMIVVDTGSTDRTMEIALQYGAKVVPFVWNDDFSAARNESLRHATGEWILYLDADERLAQGQTNALESLLRNHAAGGYTLLVQGEHQLSSGRVRQVNAYPRLFRRHPAIRFEGRVHEQITPSIERLKKPILPTNIVIEHLGYAQSFDVIQKKCRRNIALLRAQLANDPNDHYARFQLGNTLAVLQEYEAARRELEEALPSPNLSKTVRASVLNLLAEIAVQQGRVEDAIQLCEQSLRFAPRQQMARWFLAAVFTSLGRFGDAVGPLKEIVALQESHHQEQSPDIAYDLALELAHVRVHLATCYEHLARYREATETLFPVLEKGLESTETLQRFLRSHELLADPHTAIPQLEALSLRYPDNTELLLTLARNYLRVDNRSSARLTLQRVFAIEPTNPAAYVFEAQWSVQEGDDATTARVLAEAEAKGISKYELHKIAVEFALKRRDLPSAFKNLTKMYELVPADLPAVKERLALLAERLNAK